MSAPIVFTLIVSNDLVEAFGNRICQSFAIEAGLTIRFSQTEPYWKDDRRSKCIWEFSPTSSKTQSEWVALFDQVVCHNAISTDADSLEIAHYSAPGDRSDPFAVLYIPCEWVTGE